jgi:hypothetical protein
MTKRLLLALLFGMSAILLSACDNGNRGNAPAGVSGIPPGKNTATLYVQMEDTREAAGAMVDVFVNDMKLGKVTNGQSSSFTFIPRNDENTVKLQNSHVNVLKDREKWPQLLSASKNFRAAAGDVIAVNACFGPRAGYTIMGTDVHGYSLYTVIGNPSQNPNCLFSVIIKADRQPDTVEVSKLTLDAAVKRIPAGEEIISSALEQKIIRKRTIDHTIEVSEAITIGGEGGINSVVVAKITLQVEHRQRRQLKKSEEYQREVIVPGDGRKYKLIWYDVVRHGTVEVKYTVAGQPTPRTKTIPFHYKEEPILEAELVK